MNLFSPGFISLDSNFKFNMQAEKVHIKGDFQHKSDHYKLETWTVYVHYYTYIAQHAGIEKPHTGLPLIRACITCFDGGGATSRGGGGGGLSKSVIP